MTSPQVNSRSVPAPNTGAPPPRNAAAADAIFKNLTRGACLLVFSLMIGIMLSLVYGAWPAIQEYGLPFIWTQEWDPVNQKYGGLGPIFGTLVTAAIAMTIAVPVSFGIALFLTELAPAAIKRPLGTAIELLAAIPSIIYGMWGLFVVAPLFMEYVQPSVIDLFAKVPVLSTLFGPPAMGIGVFTAGVVLSIMVIPFVSSIMRDVFELVPPMLKESAYGLGATTWEVVFKVVLPYTKVGVVGGSMLGLGRALGETMAVTFLIGNAHRIDWSLFAAGNSIASTLANEFNEAVGKLHPAALIELGLLLFLITTIVLSIAKLLLMRAAKHNI